MQHRVTLNGLCDIAGIAMSADRTSGFHPKVACRVALQMLSIFIILCYQSIYQSTLTCRLYACIHKGDTLSPVFMSLLQAGTSLTDQIFEQYSLHK